MENKVILTYYDVWENVAEETLWIDSLDNKRYQIKNIPFFAPNLAYNDIITVEEDEGSLYFEEIVEPSEHSTIQITFFRNETIEQTIKDIESLNCSWEGMHEQQFIAVDIPPVVDYKKVKEYLYQQFDNKILDYKEACLSETHLKNLR
ncbi:DUF4265 domain-containing protein [Chryseobacterium potabilaquae]|uniref:DUF4265 domain-containing protein n=1 Tax=Chryseobacterium potabilaquae TaxID=2675057 RepID=A0A6N4XAV2_9FLAO|nr:DUF4265 domain-containing protein [Chryseobacterium potabilaquae]CAA7196726.1 hypothetical protein CHRY9293_02801 [Chryseobacterium potabilaquae]